eukprot:TRINITY_DN1484_c0_g2_i1.p1 TRINITY_DN1484_c0_g2~~TRINITY_DN1484_c0_g2_i1.p1  ORF type:complete len:363 (-),score=61.52 TRINITY_DN1484_c0_g2_i1:1159-2247(-)
MVDALNYLKECEPELYSHTKVSIIDVSGPFSKIQQDRLDEHHPGKARIFNKSIFNYDEPTLTGYGFVVGLELLDNLPHDKIIIKDGAKLDEVWITSYDDNEPFGKETKQSPTVVISPLSETPKEKAPIKVEEEFITSKRQWKEIHRRIADPLVIEFIQVFCKYYGIPQDSFLASSSNFSAEYSNLLWDLITRPKPMSRYEGVFKDFRILVDNIRERYIKMAGPPVLEMILYIPTGSYKLLKTLKEKFPNHGVILADFDEIPGAMPGFNAPIVQRTEGVTTLEEPTYLDAKIGDYDIFFPTNFSNLQILHTTLNPSVRSSIYSNKDFMKQHANLTSTRTKLGYNPLLQDFKNTAFFVADIPKQ